MAIPPSRLGPLAIALGALLAPVVVVLAPRDGAAVIVLATSSARAAEAIGHADGVILASFGPFGLVATSDHADFATRLYWGGAAAVLDAFGRGGCLTARPDPSSMTK